MEWLRESLLKTFCQKSPVKANFSMKSPDDISLAQWSLIEEWRAGKWKTLDFPRLAREDFDLNGVEFVNTLFEVPTEGYLKQLKHNAAAHNVTPVLIMVDDEGDGCAPTRSTRPKPFTGPPNPTTPSWNTQSPPASTS